MNKLIYLVGIPGSGKSQFAKELAKKERAEILSTDEIRREILGDDSKQKKTNLIFKILFKRTFDFLESGKSVIVDATNVDRGKRVSALKLFKDVRKECYYIDTPFEICLERNDSRKRKVDLFIMEKMRKNLKIPIINEGWDKIHYVHTPKNYNMNKDKFISLLLDEVPYEFLFERLSKVPFFSEMVGFDQENPHHQFSLSEHTFQVIDYINEYYEGNDKLLMQTAGLFHDVGKLYTKTFKPLKGYYSFFGHENVSSQIAFHFLWEMGFEIEFIEKVVAIVEMHMLINYGGDEGAREIYHLFGSGILTKLYFFKEADAFAK